MANECTPLFDPADAITVYAEAAIIGKRFIKISGPAVDGLVQVSACGAGEQMLGVAHRDAALGAKGGTYRIGVVPVKAGEAIAAGDPIASGAAGVAMIATPGAAMAGWALDDAALNADCFVILGISPSGDVLPPSAAVVDLANNTGLAGNDVIENVPDVAAAAATAVTDAMLTDGTVDAAGVNAELADLAADIIAKVNAVKVPIEQNIADLTDKVNVILARLRTRGQIVA